MVNKKTLYIAVAVAVIIGFMAGLAMPRPYIAALDGEPAAFDHSGCQYPDRTTNPVDGCDNSDPCDPAQTKGGSGDCLPIAEPQVNKPSEVVPESKQSVMQMEACNENN